MRVRLGKSHIQIRMPLNAGISTATIGILIGF
jgi:hypothetical protein